MAGLKNIEQLRNIGGLDYARSYLWDIWFPQAPSPFNDWFPAETCSEPGYNTQEKNFQLGMSEFYVPQSFNAQNLEITCYDCEKHSLEMWIKDWVDSTIYSGGKGVKTLQECVKAVYINRLSPQKKPIRQVLYWVYPTGRLEAPWDSQSNAKKLNLNFRVAGWQETSRNGVAVTNNVEAGTAIRTYIDSGPTSNSRTQ